ETMDETGVGEAVAWAESEGWQPGLGDHRPFFAADPEGFFRSVTDGETVATISVVRGSPDVAFVGLYIVAAELRGQGLGKQLWDETLGRFEGLTLGLDAVPEQVATYASEGFEPAYGNARFSAEAADLPDPEPGSPIQPATSVPFEDLVAFDAGHYFGPRPDFLSQWMNGEGRQGLVATNDGEITGFAASRPTSTGNRIGPFFAANKDTARDLLLALAGRLTGPISVDAPEPNRNAFDLFTNLGMEKSFPTTRMYRGPAPDLPLDRIYGITTLELG
ncbi:MAG TPA: GNAT family N-acetyltransferase, partial [Solirubrobacterales bacterium]|nr:GNAT family N-acetyltransferase [Solirubrobacterales bacterium]